MAGDWLFLQGMGFGVAVAAPVGPMSLLCMRRTLAAGWRPGLATGAGIAAGDGCYACVAVAGLAGLQRFMLAHERPLHLAAGLFLLYLGLRTMLARAAEADPAQPRLPRGGRAFGSALLLTLTNPPTIIMFAAIFASLSPAAGFSPDTAALTVGGVLSGSMLWWCGVVGAVSGLRHAIGATARRWIDRIAGGLLALFGAAEVRRAL